LFLIPKLNPLFLVLKLPFSEYISAEVLANHINNTSNVQDHEVDVYEKSVFLKIYKV